jgi:paired amphipathic helix protein Sin3a
VRYIFGTDAYTIFTVDKVIQALIKQIQAVAADKKSTEFASLFNTTHVNGAYRYLAEEIVPDETLYKITSVSNFSRYTYFHALCLHFFF